MQGPLTRSADERVTAMPGYGDWHPDLRYRELALQARVQQRHAQARDYFRVSARYSDKLSQAALAEMYWKGEGGEADRPLAYVWMDLAAERGTPWLLGLREKYWNALDETQLAQALREGRKIHAEYADRVARPRLERLLRTGRNNVTGSHVGWISPGLRVHASSSLGDVMAGRAPSLRGEEYYDDRYWKPESYWSWQDQILNHAPRMGSVDVGPLEQVPPAD